ncbi:MAG TPA: ZIP family metal transporter [archaeon]|nr:ZIP family metal transporter [archaeon]
MLFELFLSLAIISLASFVGVLSISIKNINKYLEHLVSLSVGALLGGAFIHLIPELAESGLIGELSIFILVGIILFFILEKFIFWHHCHHTEHKHLSFSYMNLVGDGFHNFLDGVLLAGAFLINTSVGFATAMAIFLHEIPQEIGDFGVLIKGGFSRKKALIANFLSALTSFIGAIMVLLFNEIIEGIVPIVVAITAGGFIYIAATDLIPELHKNPKIKNSLIQLVFISIGILLMFAITLLE